MLNGYSVTLVIIGTIQCAKHLELSLSDARYQCVACCGVEDINEVYHRKIIP